MNFFAMLSEAFLKILFSTSSPSLYSIATSSLFILGLVGIFRKCGIKWWMALIPCVRDYQLGRAAGREDEGRFAAVMQGVLALIALLYLFAPQDPSASERFYDFLSIVELVVQLDDR